jgi:hypothetical protein
MPNKKNHETKEGAGKVDLGFETPGNQENESSINIYSQMTKFKKEFSTFAKRL